MRDDATEPPEPPRRGRSSGGPPPPTRVDTAATTAGSGNLEDIRGLLIDWDGVLVAAGRPIPGAATALAALDRAGVPYRIATNTTLLSRRELAERASSLGFAIPPERFITAASTAAAYCARRFPGRPLVVVGTAGAKSEFAGQPLVPVEAADDPVAAPAAVVLGDSPDEITYANLNRIFRAVRAGAAFVAMHRNRWWVTEGGPTLDSGAVVAGLEYALGRRATVVGKPARTFFTEAARALAASFGTASGTAGPARREALATAGRPGRRPSTRVGTAGSLRGVDRRAIAMVGDDVWSDVTAAQRAGLRGLLVLTGKHGEEELAHLAARGRAPDGVWPSIVEVVAALGLSGVP